MEHLVTPYHHKNAFIFPIYKATNQCRFILDYLLTGSYLQQHKPRLHFRQLLTKLKPEISLLLGNFKQAQVRFHQTCINHDRKHVVFLVMVTTFLRKEIIFSLCNDFFFAAFSNWYPNWTLPCSYFHRPLEEILARMLHVSDLVTFSKPDILFMWI